MTYKKPELVALESPIVAIQGHDKTTTQSWDGDFCTPQAYQADE